MSGVMALERRTTVVRNINAHWERTPLPSKPSTAGSLALEREKRTSKESLHQDVTQRIRRFAPAVLQRDSDAPIQ